MSSQETAGPGPGPDIIASMGKGGAIGLALGAAGYALSRFGITTTPAQCSKIYAECTGEPLPYIKRIDSRDFAEASLGGLAVGFIGLGVIARHLGKAFRARFPQKDNLEDLNNIFYAEPFKGNNN